MKKALLFIIALLFINSVTHSGWFQQFSGTSVNLHSINVNHGNENMAWACGDNGIILFTTNGGANWDIQTSGTTLNLYSICYMEVAGNPIIAVGQNGIILRTLNYGTNWVQISSPTSNTLRDVSDYNFVAVGDNGTILKSTNSGLNWTLVSSPTTKRLNGSAGIFNYTIVGDSGTVLRGGANGLSWTLVTPVVTNNLYSMPIFNSSQLTVGTGGLIYRSSDFGMSWFSSPSPTNNDLHSFEYSQNNNDHAYAVGNSGTILKSTNQGVTWGLQTSPVATNLNCVFFYLDDLNGFVCGDNGVIIKTTDGGGPIFTAIEHTSENVPYKFSLGQNYPNPFNPSTKISFSIPPAGIAYMRPVRLSIYDILGRSVETLLNQPMQPGTYEIQWDASKYPSGVYFYTLATDGFSESKKMVLVK